jgi:hypothetical protein
VPVVPPGEGQALQEGGADRSVTKEAAFRRWQEVNEREELGLRIALEDGGERALGAAMGSEPVVDDGDAQRARPERMCCYRGNGVPLARRVRGILGQINDSPVTPF